MTDIKNEEPSSDPCPTSDPTLGPTPDLASGLPPFPGLVLRPLKEEDVDPLARIVQKTWFKADLPSDPEKGDPAGRGDQAWEESRAQRRLQAAKFDFLFYLLKSTHGLVAQVAGRPVGVILADVFVLDPHAHPALAGQDRLYRDHVAFLRSWVPDGGRYADSIMKDDRDTRRLYDQHRSHTEAEVVLFIVDESVRGQGVGKSLWLAMLDLLDQAGVKRYFLYTDTDCNYMFYEYRGMLRIEERIGVAGPLGEPLDKFTYLGLPSEDLSD